MWNPFKRKSEVEKLREKYEALLQESFRLSAQDRKASDAKRAEAEAVMTQILALEKKADN
jgi:hypothetical protein